jgi:hypothetical protein
MRRTLSTLAAIGVVAFTLHTPAQADNANHGKARWEGVVSVSPEAVPAMEAWGVPYVLGDGITVVDTGRDPSRPMVGADATKTLERGYIIACTVDMRGSTGRKDSLAILIHEVGHCLGLSHVYGGEKSVMGSWMSQYSPQAPTKGDLERVGLLY